MTHEPGDAVDAADGGCLLRLHVSPGADETRVEGFDEWRGRYRVRVAEPARDGRANRALLDHLGELLGCDVVLQSGASSREKTVLVATSEAEVLEGLSSV